MFKKSKKEDEELQMQAKAGLDDMGDFDSLDEPGGNCSAIRKEEEASRHGPLYR
ncbi:MAG: hypothetical protein ACLR71_22720 [[Clostridium] scindens]